MMRAPPTTLALIASIACVVAAAIVTRPLWSDARVAWSGYDALFRYAGVMLAGFFTTACVIVIRAARRARP